MDAMKNLTFLSRREQSTWIPPVQQILAYLHGGRIFTETLPYLARTALGIGTTILGVVWLFWWISIFQDYERWRLVIATLVHLAFLALVYVFVRVAWLRIDHLRHLPQEPLVAIRSLPILLRMTAELGLIFSIASMVRAFLMPPASWPSSLGAGTSQGGLSDSLSTFFAWLAAGGVLWVALGSVFGLLVAYGLANAIEIFLAIEQNTRKNGATETAPDHTIRHGDA